MVVTENAAVGVVAKDAWRRLPWRFMHFLLTNDDGIGAPGIAALERAVEQIPDAICTVVAPDREQSQCGHRVTTRELIAVSQQGERHYAVAGTPADCVRIALFALNIRPDFVLSGVNAGGNMGQDLYISGTVAAVREAAFHGIPAAAFSHYLVRNLVVDWVRTAEWTRLVLGELLDESLKDGEFWNVNYPHLPMGMIDVPARVRCHPCRAPLNVSYESEEKGSAVTSYRYTATYAARPVEDGSDVGACFGGGIAVSKVGI